MDNKDGMELFKHMRQQIDFLRNSRSSMLIGNTNVREVIRTPLSEIVLQFQGVNEQIKAQLNISKLVREAADDVEKSKAIILEYGFPPHYDFNIKQMRIISSYYNQHGKEKTFELLDSLYIELVNEDRINGYLSNWLSVSWLSDRYEILKEAVLAHHQGMFYASISTLLPQIEGIISERSNFIGKTAMSDLKASVKRLLSEEGDFSLDDAVKTFYVKIVLDNFTFGQEIKSPLSRHAIAHGADTKFGYKLNSIRCIILFNYLVERYADNTEEDQ